jgi:hypothetical protein
LTQQGQVKARRVGRKSIRYLRADLEAFVAAQKEVVRNAD